MCIGAMDGKHIVLKKPANTGSTYYNYKHTFSLQLLAVVDSQYRFLYVDAGCQGRIGDAGVFANSTLCTALATNSLHIPEPETIPSTDTTVPYVLVADDAFPLTPCIMKPYAHRGQNQQQRIFNYRLSRARRTVENAFGILSARFRVFRGPLEINPQRATDVVMAATVLHNYLLDSSRSRSLGSVAQGATSTADNGDRQTEIALGMRGLRPCLQKNPPVTAKTVRHTFTDYFMTQGQVPWQWDV